jgi:Tol biopolymer transport system component
LPPATSPPDSLPSSAPVNVSVKWVEGGAYTDIYLVYADGSEVNLTNDTHRENNAVLSPDRTKVAFERGAPTQIFVINVDGTGSTQLTFNPHSQVRPEWSGDGTEIFFTSWEDDKRYAVSIISKQIRPLE